MSEPSLRGYVTSDLLSQRLGVNRMTISRFIRDGRLKAVKVNDRLWLIPEAEADRFASTYTKGRHVNPRPRRQKD